MVECKHCGEPTMATAIRECSACWRLRTLIENRPLVAIRMIMQLDMRKVAGSSMDHRTTKQGEEA